MPRYRDPRRARLAVSIAVCGRNIAGRPHVLKHALRSSLREVDDALELTKSNSRVVAEAHPRSGDFVGPLGLVADDVKAFREAVVIVAEEKRIFAVRKDSAVGRIALDDGNAASGQRIHRPIVDHIIHRGHAQHGAARGDTLERQPHPDIRGKRCDRADNDGGSAVIGLDQHGVVFCDREYLQTAKRLHPLLDELAQHIESLRRDDPLTRGQRSSNVRVERSGEIVLRANDRLSHGIAKRMFERRYGGFALLNAANPVQAKRDQAGYGTLAEPGRVELADAAVAIGTDAAGRTRQRAWQAIGFEISLLLFGVKKKSRIGRSGRLKLRPSGTRVIQDPLYDRNAPLLGGIQKPA